MQRSFPVRSGPPLDPSRSPAHFATSAGYIDANKVDRAFRATRRMKEMVPMLNGVVRAMTGDPRSEVLLTNGTPCTDGRRIWLRPPMQLGDNFNHARAVCARRDPATSTPICPACAQLEVIHQTLFHEMAHIVFESMMQVSDYDKAQIVQKVLREFPAMAGSRIEKLQRKIDEAARSGMMNYLGISQLVSPFLPTIINALEDARVNQRMYAVRNGTFHMFRSKLINVLSNGTEMLDGTMFNWHNEDENGQIIIGLLCKASGVEPRTGWLSDPVLAALKDDELNGELLAFNFSTATAADVYHLGFRMLEHLRRLGFCRRPDDPKDDADESQDDNDAEPSDQDQPPQAGSGDSAGSDDPSAESSDESIDDDVSDSGERGGGSGSDSDPSMDDDNSEHDDDELDDADDSGDDSAGSDPSDSADTDEDESDSSGSGESSPEQGDEPETERSGDVSDGQSSGEDSEEDEDDEGDESGNGSPSQELGDDVPSAESSDDGEDASGQADDDIDQEAANEREEASDPDTVNHLVNVFGGHDDTSPDDFFDDSDFERALGVAMVQAEQFDEVSTTVARFNVHEFDQPNERSQQLSWKCQDPNRYQGYEVDDYVLPENVINHALLKMRTIFADNKRAKWEGELRSGRVVSRRLASVMAGNTKVFSRATKPGRKDYFVCLALDVSGSTQGERIEWIKKLGMTVGALLSRSGVRFAVYAHCGNPTRYGSSMMIQEGDVFVIKEENDPWDTNAKERLAKLNASGNNLDGHALEFFRKRCDRATETDKIILYVTDGEMPEANRADETEVLKREIAECRKRNYSLVGIGIETDSPKRHGLDTIRIDDTDDINLLVRELERRLAVRV